MKMICIDEDLFTADGQRPAFDYPKVGDIVTVDKEVVFAGVKMYLLAEFPAVDGKRGAFDADCFAPLNGPDMSERDEAYQREQLAMEGKLFEGVAAILAEEEKMPQDVWERNRAAIEERLNAGR